MGEQRLRPNGAFETERDRERVLQMRAAGHHRVPVRVRLRASAAAVPESSSRTRRQSLTNLQHHGRVHDVLRRRAPVRPAARLARRSAQPLDHADHRIADVAHARRELVGVEIVDARRRRDRLRRLGRDDAEPALHLGESRLHVQHALQERALVEDGAHGVRPVERAENRTVCGIDRHGVLRRGASAWTSVAAYRSGLHFLECLLGEADRGIRGGDAGVDGHLDQHVGDIFLCRAGISAGAYVQLELLVVSQRRHHRKSKQRSRTPVELRTRPDAAPCGARDEMLELAVETRDGRRRARDMLLTKDLLSNFAYRLRSSRSRPERET